MNNIRAENEKVYREVCERMLALGAPEKGAKRIRLCETMAFMGDRFQRRFYAWKFTLEHGNPGIKVFQIGYQNEGENPMLRNIAWLGCSGYQIAFPGEKCRSYYMGSPGQEYAEERFHEWRGKFNPYMFRFYDESKLKEDPKLKYFVPNDWGRIMFEIDLFRRHPQSESLFKLGLGKLAMQERLYQLSPETAKVLIRYISKNLEDVRSNQNLNVILGWIAKGITAEEFMAEHKIKMAKRDDYIQAQGIDLHDYVEYLAMAKSLGYDMKDKKHIFPRDFKATFKAIKDEGDKRKNKRISEQISRIAASMASSEGSFLGFRFAFPKSFMDFREQAETLGNCLISNEYYLRHAKGKCIIVFVFDENDKRVGTAEISDGVVRQFTGNQKHASWRPSEPMKNAMDAWMANSFLPHNQARVSV